MTFNRRIFKQDEFRETGFGNRVLDGNERLMNKDGSSNVKRTGFPLYILSNIYHSLITMNPIDEESPLYNWTEEDYRKNEVEFLVLIKAYEETFAQTVHARSSYHYDEIVFGTKFNTVIKPDDDGSVSVELNRINDHQPTPLHEEFLQN